MTFQRQRSARRGTNAGAGPTTDTDEPLALALRPELVGHRRGIAFRVGAVGATDGELDQPAERRRPEPATQVQLGVVEGTRPTGRGGHDGRVFGLVGLQERATWPLPSPGAADGLDQELVRPLRGALVGEVQRDIGRHDPDDGHARDIEALGDQARADEDVQPVVRERIDDAFRGALPFRDITVQPADAESREPVADLALHPFRATTEIADPRGLAGRTAGRERRRPAAVVAAERRAGLVVDERSLAVRAGLDMTAVAAEHHGRRPAPVQHEDGLVAGRRVEGGQRRCQRSRDQAALTVGELLSKIDDLDLRGRA